MKRSIAAGATHEAIFADLAKLDARLAKSRAKSKKITGRNKRTKAEQKATAHYLKKPGSLAARLEKLAGKHAGSYCGRAASRSHKAYLDSQGQKLTDRRRE